MKKFLIGILMVLLVMVTLVYAENLTIPVEGAGCLKGIIVDEACVPCEEPVNMFTDYKLSVSVGEVPLTVNFINESENVRYRVWNFGDGSEYSTEESPTHTYTKAGKYIVTLTNTAENGDVAEKQDEVTVTSEQTGTRPPMPTGATFSDDFNWTQPWVGDVSPNKVWSRHEHNQSGNQEGTMGSWYHPKNVWVEDGKLKLIVRANDKYDGRARTGEIASTGRYEASIKMPPATKSSSHGVVSGFWIYEYPSNDEIDFIEIETNKDSNLHHHTVHDGGKQQGTCGTKTDAQLGVDSTKFNVYRADVYGLDDKCPLHSSKGPHVDFFINDKYVCSLDLASNFTYPTRILFSLYNKTKPYWGGEYPPTVDSVMEVDWVAYTKFK